MKRSRLIAAGTAALALAACSSGSAAPSLLSTSCNISPAQNGNPTFSMNVALSLPPTSASAPAVHVSELVIALQGVPGVSQDTSVTEHVSQTVPGTATAGWGNGVTVTFPAPQMNGYLPGGCNVKSWR